MGGTAWIHLEMAHRRQSRIQEHRQAPVRLPLFHSQSQMCKEMEQTARGGSGRLDPDATFEDSQMSL